MVDTHGERAHVNWHDIATASVTLFFIMDPLGNVPVFHAVLAKCDENRRTRIIILPKLDQFYDLLNPNSMPK